ncbi:MAG: DNA polymerase III subunit beta [Gammaproteobacteria bacterium]|nr:MAG: DNA polymerase III subunit beta [Gammaproteobacteria bacterium]
MKFKVQREVLLTPLQLISGVVEKRNTMPVLANVLMETTDTGLRITGTNMEVELVANVDQVSVEQPGRITVPARKLTDICRTMAEGVTLECDVREGRLHVQAGHSSFTLSTLPADSFPNVEDEPESVRVNLPQNVLKRLIDRTGYAMAQQDVRYYLNGMLFEFGGNRLSTVATDGHRLALARESVAETLPERQSIVPRKGVLEMARLLSDSDGTCALVLGDHHIRLEVDGYVFTSKLIDGKFPDYNRVIPRNGDKVVKVDRREFKQVLTRTSILCHESIRGVRLFLEDGLMKVYANNPEQEEAEDRVEVEYQGEPLQIGFNVGYLIDAISALEDETITLTLSNPNSSALLEGEQAGQDDVLYVVMPMRL